MFFFIPVDTGLICETILTENDSTVALTPTRKPFLSQKAFREQLIKELAGYSTTAPSPVPSAPATSVHHGCA
jgi:hypothetical protein